MKVVMLEAPRKMLAERRRLGLDGRDEMWDGAEPLGLEPHLSWDGGSADL